MIVVIHLVEVSYVLKNKKPRVQGKHLSLDKMYILMRNSVFVDKV